MRVVQSMSMNKTWKEVEKKVAAFLSVRLGHPFERVTVSSPIPYDVVPEPELGFKYPAPLIGIECKSRKTVPAWLTDAVAQAANHQGHSKTFPLEPVVVIATRRQDPEDYLAVMPIHTLLRIMEGERGRGRRWADERARAR